MRKCIDFCITIAHSHNFTNSASAPRIVFFDNFRLFSKFDPGLKVSYFLCDFAFVHGDEACTVDRDDVLFSIRYRNGFVRKGEYYL